MFKKLPARFLTPFYFVFDVIEHYSHFRKYGSFANSFRYIRTSYKLFHEFPKGSIVENCQFHACLVLDNDGENIDLLSLHSGVIGSCSTRHCGIVLLSPDYIEQKIKAYKIAGDKGLAMLEGWSEKDYDEFRKQWRPDDVHIGLTPMNRIRQAQHCVEEAQKDLERGIKPETEFGSELVRLIHAIRKLRDTSIKQEFIEGVPGGVLAPKYGLSPARISQITKHIWPKKQ